MSERLSRMSAKVLWYGTIWWVFFYHCYGCSGRNVNSFSAWIIIFVSFLWVMSWISSLALCNSYGPGDDLEGLILDLVQRLLITLVICGPKHWCFKWLSKSRFWWVSLNDENQALQKTPCLRSDEVVAYPFWPSRHGSLFWTGCQVRTTAYSGESKKAWSSTFRSTQQLLPHLLQ